jgi:TolB-like protein
MYCLDDGTALLEGPTSLSDDPPTAVFKERTDATSSRGTSEDVTKVHTADASSFPAKVSSSKLKSASRRLPILVSILALVLISGVGFIGYRYFRSSSAAVKSIAVLPFQNRSDDADTDYLSDGLAESLIFRLSQLPGLKVSPTSSVMRYKGKDADPEKIAAELGVDAVMSGRLIKRGDNLGITVELVDARDNKVMWGEQYDRKLADLLATQREIAATIVQKLQLTLSGSETKGITKQYTNNNEAYQLWMKGRFHFARRTKEELEKSIEAFRQAVALDPNFALAFSGMAESYAVMPSFPYASPAECIPKAKAAVQRALEIDPDLPEAHTVSGVIAAGYDWDWAKADGEFKRALELDPNLTITHYRNGWMFLSPLGRHDEAIAEMKLAMEKEPLSLIQGANFAAVLMYARRFDDALEQAKKTYNLDPTFVGGESWLCHAYNAHGDYEETLALATKTMQVNSAIPTSPFNGDLVVAYSKTGRRKEAQAVLDKWKQKAQTEYVSNYWFAIGYAAYGDKDAAFAELEKAYQNHDWFMQRIKVDPMMDPLRDDPRFDAMVKRLKFPE